MIISLNDARSMLGERTNMKGDEFCNKYGLAPVESNIKMGRGRVWLFDETEVLEKQRDIAKERVGTAGIDDTPYPVGNALDYLCRQINIVERKLDRLLDAFDLPKHDA